MDGIWVNVVSFAALVVLIGTFFLRQRLQHFAHALFIFALGLSPLLHRAGILGVDLSEITVMRYMLTLVVVMAGRELVRKGFVEKGKEISQASMWLGIILILIVMIPSLAEIGALTFKIPEYPWIVDSVLYMAGGALLFIGAIKTAE